MQTRFTLVFAAVLLSILQSTGLAAAEAVELRSEPWQLFFQKPMKGTFDLPLKCFMMIQYLGKELKCLDIIVLIQSLLMRIVVLRTLIIL